MANSDLPLDDWIAHVLTGEYLPEADLKQLCRHVSHILIEESNVQHVPAPVVVCGDIHGQFWDMLELFRQGGDIASGVNYIFLGDIVDRGNHSLEVLTLLMLFKCRWPARITLLRGNHESRQVTRIYGFFDECIRKYGGASAWFQCCDLFDQFVIAAIIEEQVLCVHGGLSPEVKTIDQIRVITRLQEIPNEGAFCDLLWSDPESITDWGVSPRGAGWLFGSSVTYEFLHTNDLSLICRAHQMVQEGYKYHFGNNLITVWSAPNYVYRCKNLASILKFDEHMGRELVIFREVDEPSDANKCERFFM